MIYKGYLKKGESEVKVIASTKLPALLNKDWNCDMLSNPDPDARKEHLWNILQTIISYFKRRENLKMDIVCKYFQCGFGKFGESCRKQHVKEICPTQSCTLSSCMKRHPKVCKYFLVQKSCKFGEHRSYKHVENNNQNDISELKKKSKLIRITNQNYVTTDWEPYIWVRSY